MCLVMVSSIISFVANSDSKQKIYMDENADGAKKVARYLTENHMKDAQKIYTRDELLTIHTKYFRTIHEKNIYEGIAESVEGDLIPC